MSLNTTSAADKSDKTAAQRFYVVSTNKLIYMTIMTTGLYILYWFYRNWAAYRDSTGDRVIPLLRAIIPVIFIFPLVHRIDEGLKQSGRQHEWSPNLLAAGLWLILAICLFSGILAPEPTGGLRGEALLLLRALAEAVVQLLAVLWVMYKLQQAINVLADDPQGASNADFSGANKGWMAFGTLIWVSNIISALTLLSYI